MGLNFYSLGILQVFERYFHSLWSSPSFLLLEPSWVASFVLLHTVVPVDEFVHQDAHEFVDAFTLSHIGLEIADLVEHAVVFEQLV